MFAAHGCCGVEVHLEFRDVALHTSTEAQKHHRAPAGGRASSQTEAGEEGRQLAGGCAGSRARILQLLQGSGQGRGWEGCMWLKGKS